MKKIVGWTKITEQRNLGTFLYNMSCKWESHMRKIGEAEEMLTVDLLNETE
jgi:hypothetical protein